MSKRIHVILVMSGLLIWSSLLFGQANWQTDLQEYLTLENQRLGFNGVCLVARDGEVLYHKAFGTASVEYKLPMNTDHRFKGPSGFYPRQ